MAEWDALDIDSEDDTEPSTGPVAPWRRPGTKPPFGKMNMDQANEVIADAEDWMAERAARADAKEQRRWDALTLEEKYYENPNLDPAWQKKVAGWHAEQARAQEQQRMELEKEEKARLKQAAKELKRAAKAFESPPGGLLLQGFRQRFKDASTVGRANFDRSEHLRNIGLIKTKIQKLEVELVDLDRSWTDRSRHHDQAVEAREKQVHENLKLLRTRGIDIQNAKIKKREASIAEIEAQCPAALAFDAEFKALAKPDDAEWRALMAEAVDEAIKANTDPSDAVKTIKKTMATAIDARARGKKMEKDPKKVVEAKKATSDFDEDEEEEWDVESVVMAGLLRDHPDLPMVQLAKKIKEAADAWAKSLGFKLKHPSSGPMSFAARLLDLGLATRARKGEPLKLDITECKDLPPCPGSFKYDGKRQSTRLSGEEVKVAEAVPQAALGGKDEADVPMAAAPVPVPKAASGDASMQGAGSGAGLPEPDMPPWLAAQAEYFDKRETLVDYLRYLIDEKYQGVEKTLGEFYEDYIAVWNGCKVKTLSMEEFDREATKLIPNVGSVFHFGDYSKVPKAKPRAQ